MSLGGRGHVLPHRQPALVGLVAAGGAVGSVIRYLVALALPTVGGDGTGRAHWPDVGWPAATLTVNLVGAFALGWLLERLGRAGAETPRLRALRLALGTGMLGGFTTYSAFALETWTLLDAGRVLGALGYVTVTICLGTAACLAGIAVAAHGAQRGAGTTRRAAGSTRRGPGSARRAAGNRR